MTVFYNKGRGRWSYNFMHRGTKYQGYCTDPDTEQPAKSKTEARAIEGKIRARLPLSPGASIPARAGAFTLAEAAAMHLANVRGRHLENVKGYVAEILNYFGPATAVTDLSAPRIADYKALMLRQPVRIWRGGPKRDAADPRNASFWKATDRTRNAATCNRYLDALSAMLTAAHNHRDPITGRPALPFPPRIEGFPEPKRIPTPIDDADLYAIADVARPWVVDAAELIRAFGLRRTEALTATRHWIEWQLRGLRLPASVTKSGNEEFVPGGPAAMATLARLDAQAKQRGVDNLVTWPGVAYVNHKDRPAKADTAPPGYKPPEPDWQPLKEIKRSWRSAKKAAGLAGDGKRRRVHDVRASYITGIAKGASDWATQDAARHADPATTRAYIKLARDDVRAAIVAAEQRREPRPNKTATESGTDSLTEVTNAGPAKVKVVR